MIDEILRHNEEFVSQQGYECYLTSKFPNKKLAVVTCMDSRLIELLPAALGIKNGDAKIIKNAGGTIAHPFGSVVRSLLIAVYELGVQEILVVGHTDCGVQHMDAEKMLHCMTERSIPSEHIALAEDFGIHLNEWLTGFNDVYESVENSCRLLTRHPLMPKDVGIYGFVMDSETGKLNEVPHQQNSVLHP